MEADGRLTRGMLFGNKGDGVPPHPPSNRLLTLTFFPCHQRCRPYEYRDRQKYICYEGQLTFKCFMGCGEWKMLSPTEMRCFFLHTCSKGGCWPFLHGSIVFSWRQVCMAKTLCKFIWRCVCRLYSVNHFVFGTSDHWMCVVHQIFFSPVMFLTAFWVQHIWWWVFLNLLKTNGWYCALLFQRHCTTCCARELDREKWSGFTGAQ